MSRENLVALSHVVSWSLPLVVRLFADNEIPITKVVAKPLGMAVFLLGMFMFAWAVAYLKGAFLGNAEPKSDKLITSGPYRLVRHPVYLSMVISAIGLAIGLRSLWGVMAVLFLLIPVGIYRAKLEESALKRRFGTAWDNYAKRTYLMFPPIC